MSRNLSQLIASYLEDDADRPFGVVDSPVTFAQLHGVACGLALELGARGVTPGSRVVLHGTNSNEYLAGWLALQLAGAEAALVNPQYPVELLNQMLDNLDPTCVLVCGEPVPGLAPKWQQHVLSGSADAGPQLGGEPIEASSASSELPGLDRAPADVAGYIHTSGTTGVPKFCRLTHEYHLRLGRYIADGMLLSRDDTVFAPLPLFHINPLGYGVIGALTGGSRFVSAPRFSASGFWDQVRSSGSTVAILHLPPVEILKRRTTAEDAAGHLLRLCFACDGEFLERYEIPIGITAYGSTEAGGLCHMHVWRRGDVSNIPEGMTRRGGRARPDVEWRISDDDEILVRGTAKGVLFDGYFGTGADASPFDEGGWFATGDLGRIEEDGDLVFIERRAESIRLKGEFVPIGYVESQLAEVPGMDDFALWKQPGELGEDEVVLFMVGSKVPEADIVERSQELPAFMRPTRVLRVDEIPRDDGVGKVRRRLLSELDVVESVEL